MVEIKIICSTDELKKIMPILKKQNILVEVQPASTHSLDLRRNLIMKHVEEGISKERLYRRLRTKGYSHCRKTFDRDIKWIKEEGLLTTEFKRKGITHGTVSIIHLVEKNSVYGK